MMVGDNEEVRGVNEVILLEVIGEEIEEILKVVGEEEDIGV